MSMSKSFRILNIIHNEIEEKFMVSSLWTTDGKFEISFLSCSTEYHNQWRTTITAEEIKELAEELGSNLDDHRLKIMDAFSNPQSDIHKFEICDELFMIFEKSGRNSKIILSADLKAAVNLQRDLLIKTVEEFQDTQDTVRHQVDQIADLKKKLHILEQEMRALVEEKTKNERVTFNKFLRLLNFKKEKIRELRKELNPDEDFDESEEEPLHRPGSSDSESDSDSEKNSSAKRKSFELDDSDDDFTAQTQVLGYPAADINHKVLPKRVKLEELPIVRPGTSKELETNETPKLSQTSQELLELL